MLRRTDPKLLRRLYALEREVIFLRVICALVSAVAVLAIVSIHLKT